MYGLTTKVLTSSLPMTYRTDCSPLLSVWVSRKIAQESPALPLYSSLISRDRVSQMLLFRVHVSE